MLRKLILGLAMGFNASALMAQSVALPLIPNGTLDVSNLLSNLHPAYAYDQHGDNIGAVYVPLVSFTDAAGNGMVDLDGGFDFAKTGSLPLTSGAQGGIIGSIAFRFDNIIKRATSGAWFKTHMTYAPLPAIEVGPLGGYDTHLGGWIYGLFVSTKI